MLSGGKFTKNSSIKTGDDHQAVIPDSIPHEPMNVEVPMTTDDRDMGNMGPRIGERYQAVLPDFIPNPSENYYLLDKRATLVWKPLKNTPRLSKYLNFAQNRFGLNEEQSLMILFKNENNVRDACHDCLKYVQRTEGWSDEE